MSLSYHHALSWVCSLIVPLHTLRVTYVNYVFYFVTQWLLTVIKITVFIREYSAQCNTKGLLTVGTSGGPNKQCQSKLRDQFSCVSIPLKSTIYQLWNKFQTTCSLLNNKLQRSQCVLLKETFDIWVDSEASLQKSSRHLSQATSVPKSFVHAAKKTLHMKPYKFTAVQKSRHLYN